MNNQLAARISVQTIELPANVASSIRVAHFRQSKSDCILIFAIFAFGGLGVAGIARWLFFGEMSSAFAMVIAAGCGLFAALGVMLVNFQAWPSIAKDLKAGACVEAEVVCNFASRVRFHQNSLEGLALDCGDDTFVMIGAWWLNRTRLDIWDDPKSLERFPGRRFFIQYLPISGRVVSVRGIEGKLQVDVAEPFEPILDVTFSKYADVMHVTRPLPSMIIGG